MLLLTLGHTLLTLTAFPSLGVRWQAAWPILFICSAAVFGVCHTRLRKWLLPLVGAAAILAAAFSFKSFSYLLSDVFAALQKSTGHIFLAETPQGKLWPMRLFLLLGGAALEGAAAYTGSALWLLPMLTAVLEGSVTSVIPVGAGTVILMIGLLLFMGLRGADLRTALHRCTAILLCAALTGGVGLLLRDVPQQKAAQQIRRAAHTAVYDRRTNSMPEGNLKKAGEWKKSDAPALRVTMEKPQSQYLRGAIYETYTGTRWAPLSAATRAEYGELFAWMHANGFYGQSAVYSVLTTQQKKLKPQQVTVQNVSACRAHGYLPYGAGGKLPFDETLIGDAQIPAKAQTFACIPTDPDTLLEAAQRIAAEKSDSELSRMEGSLAAYAQNVDLSLTDEAFEAIAGSFGAPKVRSKADALRAIRKFLRNTLTYDESAQTAVRTDFLSALLKDKRGYSVHYATAAVLLLRYCGVPARYVEGYYMSEKDAAKAQDGETVTLTESCAHAWAEYYLDGVGFVPFEVTPGYTDSEQENGEVPEDSATRPRTKKPVEAPTAVPDTSPSDASTAAQGQSRGLWILFLLPIAAIALWIAVQRLRLRRKLRSLDVPDHRESILRRYAYACALLRICPASVRTEKEARKLCLEAQFSDHPMTAQHRAQMDAYVRAVCAVCLQKWNLPQRIYYRFLHAVV